MPLTIATLAVGCELLGRHVTPTTTPFEAVGLHLEHEAVVAIFFPTSAFLSPPFTARPRRPSDLAGAQCPSQMDLHWNRERDARPGARRCPEAKSHSQSGRHRHCKMPPVILFTNG